MLKAVVRLVINYGMKSSKFMKLAVIIKDKKLKYGTDTAGICRVIYNRKRLEGNYGEYWRGHGKFHAYITTIYPSLGFALFFIAKTVG